MSYTEFDDRLQGAKRATVWPTVAGAQVLALIVASPVTGQVVMADLLAKLPGSFSFDLTGLSPHSAAFDPGREEGWIYCDSGWLVRVASVIVGTRMELVELARAKVTDPDAGGHAKWAEFAASTIVDGRRIASGRVPIPVGTPPVPFLNNTSALLHRNENADRRIIDTRSNFLIICPVGHGTIAAFNTNNPGVVELSRLSGLTPNVEAGAFNLATGYLYIADSGGQGAIVQLLQNNELRVAAEFAFPNVQGPVSCQIIQGKLVICCERRNRTLTWSLTDPEAPVLLSDVTTDTGLYWERNPVRFVYSDGTIIRKFGSLPSLLDHGDLPVEEAGEADFGGSIGFEWGLHGEIAALTYTLPVSPAQYQDTTATWTDSAGFVQPDGRTTTLVTRPSAAPDVFTFIMPGVAGAAYDILLRVRGRTEGHDYIQGTASPLDVFGADELAAGYSPDQRQIAPLRGVRWGTWGTVPLYDTPYITVGVPGDPNYVKFFLCAREGTAAPYGSYLVVTDTILRLRVLGQQAVTLTLEWNDLLSQIPQKVYPTGTDDAFVNPANMIWQPVDDDSRFPLVVPWSPRFPADPVVFQANRRAFMQIDMTHSQRARS